MGGEGCCLDDEKDGMNWNWNLEVVACPHQGEPLTVVTKRGVRGLLLRPAGEDKATVWIVNYGPDPTTRQEIKILHISQQSFVVRHMVQLCILIAQE